MRMIYVRFGDIPENERSKNCLTGGYEDGVSVYEAIERDDDISIILPNLSVSTCGSLSGVLDRPMYIVEGDVVGTGNDGEPLLRNCRVIKEVVKNSLKSNQGLYAMEIDRSPEGLNDLS